MEPTSSPNNIPEGGDLMPPMEMDPMQSETSMPESDPSTESPKSGGIGPMIGIIIIVVLLAVGGFYYWGSKLVDNRASLTESGDSVSDVVPTNDTVVNDLLDQDSSDTVESIEADLNDTDLNGLDGELSDIEAVLDEAI
jgi:hypothetical protein